ncbi:glucokinase [Aureimonas mangrovi]|uniref:glucokinase n=1 Tax=Aureimonas mangrovi TaxID=2758041 RepID=UPI00163D5365|nr:glucokinase [Aureimonas mangrovi]
MTVTLESPDALRFPVLVGDIGGTNARFALILDSNAEPRAFPTIATADFPNIDEAIQACVLDRTSVQPRTAVLAVAGPIDGEDIDLTNSAWVVRPQRLINDLGFDEVVILNDFEAQALAVSALSPSGRAAIGGGTARENASRVVLGPGTGLGVAGLVRSRHLWIPVAGEGGHVDLGPRTERDLEIWPHLEAIEGRISAEQILCGRGLVNLYRAISLSNGADHPYTTPAEITDAARGGGDAAAAEAVQLFAIYLARVAGDLALVFMARGGVYIGGGIFRHVLPAISVSQMRAAFEDKAPHTELMRDIPLFAITEPLAALSGLAFYAHNPRHFGLETQGRRWISERSKR